MKFISVDGEGWNVEDVHEYTLLSATTGESKYNPLGLATNECFDFLLGLKDRNPDCVFVSFYFSYDTNMILRDFSENAIEKLAAWNEVIVCTSGLDYRIKYIPNKFLTISTGQSRSEDGRIRFTSDTTLTIYDVFGFFQTSFLRAIEEFDVATPEEREFIERMKEGRADFDPSQLDEIIRYNVLECNLLSRLMDIIDDRLQAVGVELTSWHGAGAIAQAVLDQHQIVKTLPKFDLPELELEVRRAYFGGRIQAHQIGEFPACYGYDIVSAYPAALSEIPDLSNANITVCDAYIPGAIALYSVEWEVDLDSPLTPFPFRNEKGSIFYPYRGSGTYWHWEVGEALKHWPGQVRIVKGWVFWPQNRTSRPFAFIKAMFTQRARLKVAGDMAQYVLKLALNSMYGKFAQKDSNQGRTPKYQNYVYAGLITSRTRATLLSAAMQKPHAIVSFATDGILSLEPLDLNVGKHLGGWDTSDYDYTFVVQPGFYSLEHNTEDPVRRSRGIPLRSINWDTMKDLWRTWGVNGEYPTTFRTFIGLNNQSAPAHWREWVEQDKVFSYYPTHGWPDPIDQHRTRIWQHHDVGERSTAYGKKLVQILDDEKPESGIPKLSQFETEVNTQ